MVVGQANHVDARPGQTRGEGGARFEGEFLPGHWAAQVGDGAFEIDEGHVGGSEIGFHELEDRLASVLVDVVTDSAVAHHVASGGHAQSGRFGGGRRGRRCGRGGRQGRRSAKRRFAGGRGGLTSHELGSGRSSRLDVPDVVTGQGGDH